MKASIIQKGDSFVLFFCSSTIFPYALGFENISNNGKNEYAQEKKLLTSLDEKDELNRKIQRKK